jgi:hypothetical protein
MDRRSCCSRAPLEGYQIGAIDQNGAVVQAYTPVVAPGGTGFAKMLVDDEGRILIGKAGTNNDEGCGQVIRLNADFSLDNTFGSNGVAYTPPAPFQYPLFEIDNLGRMVLASYGLGSAGIWRFNVDGTMDATFSYTLDLASVLLGRLDPRHRDRAGQLRSTCTNRTPGVGLPTSSSSWMMVHSTRALASRAGHMDLSDTDPHYFTAPDELLIEPNGGLIVLAQAYNTDGYMSAKYLTRMDEFGA